MVVSSSDSSLIRAERARRDFKLFVEDAWHVIEPGKPYVGGWHLDAISEHLQAVAECKIKRLLVNMPPRHGKSSLISALWSDWLLLRDPSIRLLCASYSLNLATRDNVKARRVIQSNWFQRRYGDVFQLKHDQNAKMKFETDKLGYRMVTSVGGGTGDGGDILILDDPHNIDEKTSDLQRETAIDWFDNTWWSRLNDQQRGSMVVVGHRIHEQDVSGHILDTNDGEWVHLNLAAEYDSTNPCKTYIFGAPSVQSEQKVLSTTRPGVRHTVTFEHGKAVNCTCEDHTYHPEKACKHMLSAKVPQSNAQLFWQDPRKEDGELLWPERFPAGVIEKAKRRYGPLGYASLFLQSPTPASGGTFKKDNERLFTQNMDTYFLRTPKGIKPIDKDECMLFLSIDPAISESQNADYMVIDTWAQTPMHDLLLLNVNRGRWDHHDQQTEVQDSFNEVDVEFAAVETIAYQHALFQDLIVKGIPCKPFKPHKDKEARAATASIWQGNGKIYFLKDAPWLPELQKELYKFPKTAHDDQVDALSLASIVVRSRGPLSDADSDEDIPEAAEESGGLIPLTVPLNTTEEEQAVALQAAQHVNKPIDAFAWAEAHYGFGGDW